MGDDETLYCFVEVPKGSRNKYEWDARLQAIKLQRFLFSSVHYPTDYGFIEGTLSEKGAALDAMVCVSAPTFPGILIPVKVIAVFRTKDEAGQDDKLLCVPFEDPNWNFMETGKIEDVVAHAREKGVGLLFWYNSGGPHNDVTEAPRDRGGRRRFARTRSCVWGRLAAAGPGGPQAPRSEGDPPAPMTAYGHSKLEGERVVAAIAGLRWTILRPGVVYGPGDRALLPLFVLASRGVLPNIGYSSAAYTFVYIPDLVRAIASAVDRGSSGDVLFVGHAKPVTTRALLEGVRNAVGRRAIIVSGSGPSSRMLPARTKSTPRYRRASVILLRR